MIIDNLGIPLRLLRKLAEWGCACSQNIMGGGRRCRPLAHSSRRRPFSSCPLGAPHSASVAPRNLLIIVRKNQGTEGASLCLCEIFVRQPRSMAKVNGQWLVFVYVFVQVELRAPSYIYNSIRSGFQPAEDVLSGEKVEFFSWKQRKTAGRRCEKRGATDMKITSFSGKTPKMAHFHLRKRLKKRSKTGNFRKKRDAGKQKQKLFSLTISELPKK